MTEITDTSEVKQLTVLTYRNKMKEGSEMIEELTTDIKVKF